MNVTCFKHRKEPCTCIEVAHQGMFPRQMAMEMIYAIGAFPENVVYGPNVVEWLAGSYLTLAELMARGDVTNQEVAEMDGMLEDAGFDVED